MTLQDYINLVTDSLSTFASAKINLIIPLSVTLLIFLVGLFIAGVLKKIWFEIIKFLNIEKNLLRTESYTKLVKVNKNLSLTEGVGQLIWWLTILVFLLPSLKVLNVIEVDSIVDQLLSFLPAAAAGAFYLFLGSIFAWFAYLVTLAIGSLTNVGSALFIARSVAIGILVFSLLSALRAFGISDEIIRFITLATITSIALAFGLSGKELAADIIKKLRDLIR